MRETWYRLVDRFTDWRRSHNLASDTTPPADRCDWCDQTATHVWLAGDTDWYIGDRYACVDHADLAVDLNDWQKIKR